MTQPTIHSPDVRLFARDVPPSAWSFEESDAFTFALENRGLPALAAPDAGAHWNWSADVLQRGRWVRRVGQGPLAAPVPLGGTREFAAHLGITLIGGDYELRYGLEPAAGSGTAIPSEGPRWSSEHVPLHVKNQIREAFVELINACNFRCTYCPQTTLQRRQRPMDFALATKVVRDLADMGHHHPIRVHLLGEPLLYPRFFDFVEMAHDLGQRVNLVTNGSRFREKTIEGIFRTGVDEMRISLNSPEETLHDAERGTTLPYAEYIAGVRRMVAECARRGRPPLLEINVLYPLEQRGSPEDDARINRVANEWANVVREAVGLTPLADGEVDHLANVRRTEDMTLNLFTMIPLGQGIELQFTPYHSWGKGPAPAPHFCSYPWRQLAILVDGQATACCVDGEGEIRLGDANVQTVEEIWNGPVLNRIREAFWNEQRAVESKCANCHIRHWDLFHQYRTHVLDPSV